MEVNSAFILIICGVLLLVDEVFSRRCNEFFCASIVSKCMLTQACKCEINRNKDACSCCADCTKCLGDYYDQCCSCLEMCSEKDLPELDPNDSQVGDFSDPFPELFEGLTRPNKGPTLGFSVETFPLDATLDDLSKKVNLGKHKYHKEGHPHDNLPAFPQIGVNCTVTYMKQCYSAMKCKDQCQSMGAGGYRYFFDGCCECVGPTCLNYGINESRCKQCPDIADNYEEDFSELSPLTNTLDGDLKN